LQQRHMTTMIDGQDDEPVSTGLTQV
jgi:hypothetical protein